MTPSSPLHVVLGGTGGVGNAVVRALVAQGQHVRSVTRTGSRNLLPASVESVAADIAQLDQARAVTRDASVVYFCANPAYYRWPQDFPPLLAGAIAGAAAANATLVVADNLYVYAPTSQPMTEDLPWAPATRKGLVRKAMDETLLAAHQSGQVRIAIGRAANFYGPLTTNGFVGERLLATAIAGRAVQWLGRLDQLHSFSFIDDVGSGLVTLGAQERAWGQAWHMPVAPPLTGQQYLDLIGTLSGTSVKVRQVTPLMLRLVSLANPNAREAIEMAYEFDQPHIMDSRKFTDAFGVTGTPHRDALHASIAWLRHHQDQAVTAAA